MHEHLFLNKAGALVYHNSYDYDILHLISNSRLVCLASYAAAPIPYARALVCLCTRDLEDNS